MHSVMVKKYTILAPINLGGIMENSKEKKTVTKNGNIPKKDSKKRDVLNQDSAKDQIEKQQNFKPRDNA